MIMAATTSTAAAFLFQLFPSHPTHTHTHVTNDQIHAEFHLSSVINRDTSNSSSSFAPCLFSFDIILYDFERRVCETLRERRHGQQNAKREKKRKEKHFIYHPRKERNSISLHIKNSSFFFVSVRFFVLFSVVHTKLLCPNNTRFMTCETTSN